MKPIPILLVEDNPGDVDLTRESLEEARIVNELHVVSDGEQALAFLRREPPFEDAPRPGIVLLDLNLPRKSGREVLAEMKADPALRQIPAIVLTTSAAEADVYRSYDLGANAFVTKPVAFPEFLDAIRSLQGFWLQFVRLPGRT
jgi:CheY-like chemotaxis protein